MTQQPPIASAQEMVELLPCPFCGGSNVKTFGPYGWYRQFGISHSCGTFYSGAQEIAQGFPNEVEAIAAWNARAQASQLAGIVGERDVMVCPQCEGEGGYADGLDEAACHTDCERCGGNGWIVNLAALNPGKAE